MDPEPADGAVYARPIVMKGTMLGVTARDPFFVWDLGHHIHQFEVPPGTQRLVAHLSWTTALSPGGPLNDVPGMDLNLLVVGPEGPEGSKGARSFCANLAPMPAPGSACNRDRSEEAAVEDLEADDGTWHAYIFAERAYVDYTLTITFA